MGTQSDPARVPAEGLLELETLLIPAVCTAAERCWRFSGTRLFWRHDPRLTKPPAYYGPR